MGTLTARKPDGTVAYMGGLPALLETFMWCWSQMQEFNSEFLGPIHYDRAQVSYHAAARNNLARRMRGDWLLMLDTDHEFEPDLVARMLTTAERFGIDVLTGLYQYKTYPHLPVLYCWKDRKDPLRGVSPISNWSEDCPVFQVDSAGGGCLLIRRAVFDQIKRELNEQPFDPIHPLSEDNSFFFRLRKLGIPVWVDTRIRCRHLVVTGLDMDSFDPEGTKEGKVVEVAGHVVAG